MHYIKTVGELQELLELLPKDALLLTKFKSKPNELNVVLSGGNMFYCKPTESVHLIKAEAQGALDALKQDDFELYKRWDIESNQPLIEEVVVLLSR